MTLISLLKCYRIKIRRMSSYHYYYMTRLNLILSSKFHYALIDYHSLILIFFVFGTCLIVKEIRVLFLGSTLLDLGLLRQPERPNPSGIRLLFISSGSSTLLVNVSSLASFIPWRYLNVSEVYYITIGCLKLH